MEEVEPDTAYGTMWLKDWDRQQEQAHGGTAHKRGKGLFQGCDIARCIGMSWKEATESAHTGVNARLTSEPLKPLGQGVTRGNWISVVHEHADSWALLLRLAFTGCGS